MADYCEGLVGKDIEVLVEGYDRLAECYFGRTYADAPEVDGLRVLYLRRKQAQGRRLY